MTPLVSIVLPVYNGARYLSLALDGVLQQTYRNWELIIVDDCSTDETPAIIERYRAADARIRSVRNERNRRLPGSLNAGFALAQGEFLTWTSDDNIQRPEALAEMVKMLNGRPEIGFVYADMTAIDGTGRPGILERARDPQILAFENPVGACFLYRREVHERLGGYDEAVFLLEDYDFWLRASTVTRFARLPRDLYLYRRHIASLTTQRAATIADMWERVLTRHLPKLTWLSSSIRALAFLELARRARWRHQPGSVRRLVYRAARERLGVCLPLARQRWAEMAVTSMDPSLRSIHAETFARSVQCDEGLGVLLVYAIGGENAARWASRLRRFGSDPLAPLQRLVSRASS